MNKIVSKVQYSEKVFRLEVEAPLIAKARKAGHFVIVRVGEQGERMFTFIKYFPSIFRGKHYMIFAIPLSMC